MKRDIDLWIIDIGIFLSIVVAMVAVGGMLMQWLN